VRESAPTSDPIGSCFLRLVIPITDRLADQNMSDKLALLLRSLAHGADETAWLLVADYRRGEVDPGRFVADLPAGADERKGFLVGSEPVDSVKAFGVDVIPEETGAGGCVGVDVFA
jgi:hypothetical protein